MTHYDSAMHCREIAIQPNFVSDVINVVTVAIVTIYCRMHSSVQ